DLAYDGTIDQLVVTNSNDAHGTCSPSVTAYPGDAVGDVAPLRTVAGPAAAFSSPLGIAVTTAPIVIAKAGASQSVQSGTPVVLSGAGHSSPPGPLTFAWTQTGP